MPRSKNILIALIALVLSSCGGGCLQPARNVEPVVPSREQFFESRGATHQQPGPWWQSFDDPALDQLINQAFSGSLDLALLTTRIEQAHARVRQAGGRLWPTLDGSGNYETIWTDLEETPLRESFSSVGGLLQWEVDVWGRLRSARRARLHESMAANHDWQGGQLLLSATVAETYFEIIEQRQQLQLLRKQTQVNQTLLELTRLRFGQGLSSIVDVLQQKEQLENTRSLVPTVEARLRELEYSLDVLLGQAPAPEPRGLSAQLGVLPSWPELGVPSDLLEARPDLRAIREVIAALDYEVGEAIADRFPRFVIGGSLGVSGDPGLSSALATLVASLTGPILDGGVRKAEVELRRARLQERVLDYSARFLAAVQEVETALVRERKQTERVQLLEGQLEIAQRLLSETRNRYSQGLTDYLPVLAAVVIEQQLQRELLTSRREVYSRRVALHRALGGPMNETETTVSARKGVE